MGEGNFLLPVKEDGHADQGEKTDIVFCAAGRSEGPAFKTHLNHPLARGPPPFRLFNLTLIEMEDLFMITINLRDLYPAQYSDNLFIDVSEEVFAALTISRRQEQNQLRNIYRHRAHYSLDCTDGLEATCCLTAPSPDEIYERKESAALLHDTLSHLPDKQRHRLFACYILGQSQSEIARCEGSDKRRVGQSIQRGLRNLRKHLRDFD